MKKKIIFAAIAAVNTRMMFTFLTKDCPLFSRALIAPWRLCFLAAGLTLLCVGSHVTPSADWDYPISFIMGVCAYVCAPWTVRALVYRRWKWLAVAFLLMWVSIDGVYSLYWWSRGSYRILDVRFRMGDIACDRQLSSARHPRR